MGKFGKPLENSSEKKFFRSLTHNDQGLKFISFSFKYFSQRQFFGIGDMDSGWFASLLERLKEFNGKTAKIIENRTEKQAYRLHEIDWDGKNVPISLNDIESIPNELKKNYKNIILWQFQLSKSNGRVVGFFNEDYDIFYVVLLDPKHNLQPSRDYGYSVDDTEIAITPYEKLRMQLSDIAEKKTKCPYSEQCPVSNNVDELYMSDTMYFPIDAELGEVYKKAFSSGNLKKYIEERLLDNL